MIGSPNYIFGVYDGDDSERHRARRLHPGGLGGRSRTSSRLLRRAAASRTRTPSSPVAPTTGRSSRSASRPAACSPAPRCSRPPSRRRCTAAWPARRTTRATTSPATTSPATGRTGALYDALRADYDLVGNINTFALDVNSDAVATAVITFAFDTSTVNAVREPGKSHGAGKSAVRTRACSAVAERESRIGPVTSNRGRAGTCPNTDSICPDSRRRYCRSWSSSVGVADTRAETAIDREASSGGERRVEGEEHHCGGDLVDGAVPAHRCGAVADRLERTSLCIGRVAHAHRRRVDESGATTLTRIPAT